MNRDELLKNLIEADKDIFKSFGEHKEIEIVIAGGSSLLIRGLLLRQTYDIDTFNFSQEIEKIFAQYDINSRIMAHSDSLAENYEDRLEDVPFETIGITYKLLSLEDLVIMKLHSHRQVDYNDISNKAVVDALDWNKLETIISSGEVDVSFNQRRYQEFLDRYVKYKKDNGK